MAPTVEPVSLAEAKKHLNLYDDFTEDDDYISGLIKAAREFGEDLTGWAFAEQTREIYLDRFPAKNYIELRQYPLISVTSFTVTDYTGNVTTLQPDTCYIVDTDSAFGRVVLPFGKSWPSMQLYPVNPVKIRFVCGDVVRLPETYKQAMLVHVGLMYQYRESIPEKELQTIIRAYRGANCCLRRW